MNAELLCMVSVDSTHFCVVTLGLLFIDAVNPNIRFDAQ
jgi:hypothetical protein